MCKVFTTERGKNMMKIPYNLFNFKENIKNATIT